MLRAWWRFNNPEILRNRTVRILPHVNDTILLISAVALTVILHQYPISHAWLTGKVVFLLIYIVAGAVVLKTAFSNRTSLLALVVALAAFGMILLLAKYRSWSFLMIY